LQKRGRGVKRNKEREKKKVENMSEKKEKNLKDNIRCLDGLKTKR